MWGDSTLQPWETLSVFSLPCCDHSNIEKLVKTLCHFIYINQALNIMETLEAHDSGGDGKIGKVLLQSMEHSLSVHLQ